MKKITDIYKSLNEEKKHKHDVSVSDLIKDEHKSNAAKQAILKKKWSLNSSDIEEVIEFKKKKLTAEIAKLEEVDESSTDEGEKDEKNEYEIFFNSKLKKWGVKSPNELSDEDKKKFFDEIEKEWDKEDESSVIEKKKCKVKDVNESDDIINEDFVIGVLTAILAYSAGQVIKKLINAKKSKNKVLRQLESEKDPEKKKKLKEDYDKASSYEKQIKGEIITAKEKIDKQNIKLDSKETEKGIKKLAEFKKELQDLQDEEKLIRSRKNESVSESAEIIDTYTSKYFHFYEKMFLQVDNKEKIDEIFNEVYPKLSENDDLEESRSALKFFRNYRLKELGLD